MQARQQEIEEARRDLEREHNQLKHEIKHCRAGDGCARDMAHDVQRWIMEDDHGPLRFAHASQIIAATAALLRGLLEPATPKSARRNGRSANSLSARHSSRWRARYHEDARSTPANMCPRGNTPRMRQSTSHRGHRGGQPIPNTRACRPHLRCPRHSRCPKAPKRQQRARSRPRLQCAPRRTLQRQ